MKHGAIELEQGVTPPRDEVRFAQCGAAFAAVGWVVACVAGVVPDSDIRGAAALMTLIGQVMVGVAWTGLHRYGQRSMASGIGSFVVVAAVLLTLVSSRTTTVGRGTAVCFAVVVVGGCGAALRDLPVTRFFAIAAGTLMMGGLSGPPSLRLVGMAFAATSQVAMIGEFPDTSRTA